jgi:hypothetical protein
LNSFGKKEMRGEFNVPAGIPGISGSPGSTP